jgi:hypothetical protein
MTRSGWTRIASREYPAYGGDQSSMTSIATFLCMTTPAKVKPSTPQVEPFLRSLFDSEPDTWVAVDEGGYSGLGRWVVTWDDGRSAFVKAAIGDGADPSLHNEWRIYQDLHAPWLPELFGYQAGDDVVPSVLVIEDLSTARWGTPLDARDASLLRDALEEMAARPVLDWLDPEPELKGRWTSDLAAAPARLAESGLVDGRWLAHAMPDLLAAESSVDLDGDRLLHPDLFVQNWCRAGRGAVLVDWEHPCRGNPVFNLAWGELGVRCAGGPAGSVLAAGQPGWAAYMAGLVAWFLLDHDEPPSPRLTETERREAYVGMCWAADEPGLARPVPAPGFLPAGPWRP